MLSAHFCPSARHLRHCRLSPGSPGDGCSRACLQKDWRRMFLSGKTLKAGRKKKAYSWMLDGLWQVKFTKFTTFAFTLVKTGKVSIVWLLPSALFSLSSRWSKKVSFSELWQSIPNHCPKHAVWNCPVGGTVLAISLLLALISLFFTATNQVKGQEWHAKQVSSVLWKVHLLARRRGDNKVFRLFPWELWGEYSAQSFFSTEGLL